MALFQSLVDTPLPLLDTPPPPLVPQKAITWALAPGRVHLSSVHVHGQQRSAQVHHLAWLHTAARS